MYGSWGSFGSYSSLSSTLSQPMDISSGTSRSHDASCAFPSWPRRSSLDNTDSERPTSFLSDDDLMGDPFEDDALSVSSGAGSNASSPQPHMVQQPTDEELFAMQRERAVMERELVRHIITEKERKRQAKKAAAAAAGLQHRKNSPKKSSHRSKLTSMSIIEEAVEGCTPHTWPANVITKRLRTEFLKLASSFEKASSVQEVSNPPPPPEKTWLHPQPSFF